MLLPFIFYDTMFTIFVTISGPVSGDHYTRYHISVDQFFFPNSNAEKSTGRRQLDALLDGMSDKGIRIVTATAKEISEVEKEGE